MRSLGWCAALVLVGCGSGSDGGGALVVDAPPRPDAALGAVDAPALVSCGPPTDRLDLADVAFLIPLPETNDDVDAMLGLDAAGARGELLPQAIYEQTLPLVPFSHLARSVVKIVGVRIDPCVAGGADATTCRPQLRLVGQQIFTQDAAPPTTIDAAIHLFYDLDAAALERVLAGVRALKTQAGRRTFCQPLGPHPVIAAEGLRGTYARTLFDLVLAEAGPGTLSRVAVMQLARSQTSWIFSTVDVGPDDAVTPFPVPLTDGATEQIFTIVAQPGRALVTPPAEGSRLTLLLLPDELVAAPEADARAALAESLAIEDPAVEHAGALDCVSCHVSHRARASALAIRPLALDAAVPSVYDTTVLESESLPHPLSSQRMFGYFFRDPSLSPRVIHEVAEIAAALELAD